MIRKDGSEKEQAFAATVIKGDEEQVRRCTEEEQVCRGPWQLKEATPTQIKPNGGNESEANRQRGDQASDCVKVQK